MLIELFVDLSSNKLMIFSVNVGGFRTSDQHNWNRIRPTATFHILLHISKSMKAYLKLWSCGKAKWMVILTFWLFVYNFPTANLFSTRMKIYHSVVSCISVKQPITFIACCSTKKQLPGFVMQNILTLEGVSKWFMIV